MLYESVSSGSCDMAGRFHATVGNKVVVPRAYVVHPAGPGSWTRDPNESQVATGRPAHVSGPGTGIELVGRCCARPHAADGLQEGGEASKGGSDETGSGRNSVSVDRSSCDGNADAEPSCHGGRRVVPRERDCAQKNREKEGGFHTQLLASGRERQGAVGRVGWHDG